MLGDRRGVERGGDGLERRGGGAGGVVPAREGGDQDRRAQLAAAPLPSSVPPRLSSVPRAAPAPRRSRPRRGSRSPHGGCARPDPPRGRRAAPRPAVRGALRVPGEGPPDRRAPARPTCRCGCAIAPARSRRAPSATPTASGCASRPATRSPSAAGSSATAASSWSRSTTPAGWSRGASTRPTSCPAAYRSVDELEGFLEHLAREIADPALRGVVESVVFAGPLAADFRRAPCTRARHHAYLGGLLEHTVAVATLVGETCTLHPRLDSDC